MRETVPWCTCEDTPKLNPWCTRCFPTPPELRPEEEPLPGEERGGGDAEGRASMNHVTCLNCGERTANHAICDRCFAAAEKQDGSFARRSLQRKAEKEEQA